MSVGGEEKILVSVRIRPLNEKEKTRNDRCDWECINDTTIICKFHNLPDKSSYTFDKVFGFECPTKQVYDDGAKEVALCVLSGINSSIFAYGQTSSGKTYTMSGITEFAMNDIFAYIDKESPETMRKQTAKALAREREWLAKQIPNKFGKKEKGEVYKKWGVELSSKRRSLQVTHKLWNNTKDIEHCKESASLVATLVGFVGSTLTPKEMFGLSFSPTTFNIKPSSGWGFSNSFSRISFTG